MCFSRTKAVLIHELTHAYIESTGQLTIAQFEQEHICEFMSFYAKPILDIADEFIELNLNV